MTYNELEKAIELKENLDSCVKIKKVMETSKNEWWSFTTPKDDLHIPRVLQPALEKAVNDEILGLEEVMEKL